MLADGQQQLAARTATLQRQPRHQAHLAARALPGPRRHRGAQPQLAADDVLGEAGHAGELVFLAHQHAGLAAHLPRLRQEADLQAGVHRVVVPGQQRRAAHRERGRHVRRHLEAKVLTLQRRAQAQPRRSHSRAFRSVEVPEARAPLGDDEGHLRGDLEPRQHAVGGRQVHGEAVLHQATAAARLPSTLEGEGELLVVPLDGHPQRALGQRAARAHHQRAQRRRVQFQALEVEGGERPALGPRFSGANEQGQ